MQNSTDNNFILKNTKLILSLFLSFCAIFSFAQDLVNHQGAIQIEVDNLDQFYLIDDAGNITKYNQQGKLLKNYSSKKLGMINSADVTNPLDIQLFYRSYNKIVRIDNELTEKGVIELEKFGMHEASAACYSNDGKAWVFDRVLQRAYKLNERKVHTEGDQLEQAINTTLNPTFMYEGKEWLYLHDNALGIIILDLYGRYYKTIPLIGIKNLQVKDNFLYYYKGDDFFRYRMKVLSEEKIEISPELIDYKIGKKQIFQLTENSVNLRVLE